jgi:hypothetical protein
MKFVKLTAKPDTWFKEGTEVYDYNCNAPEQLQRVSLDEWESCVNFEGIKAICVRGLRNTQLEYEIEIFGKGERWDGECCWCDEFEVEIVDEPF